MNSNHEDLLGLYFGENELSIFLNLFGINKIPKISKNEKSVNIPVADKGIEFCFKNQDALDFPFRNYPEGAKVLSAIFFYGSENENHKLYTNQLPKKLDFSMHDINVINALGTPSKINSDGESLRWDSKHYCIFAEFNAEKKLIELVIQLHNKYTMN
jgi:hypothetical protein